MKRYKPNWLVLYLVILLMVTASISGKCQKLIKSELQIRDALSKVLNYDEFRDVRIDKKDLDKIRKYTNDF